MTLLRMLAFAPAKAISQPALVAPAVAARPVAPAEKSGHAPAEPALASHTSGGGATGGEAMSGSQPDWGILLQQLNLQSMAQQLAKHCVLENFSDRQITLRLSQQQKHLQTRAATDKLQAALGDYFAKPVKLNIVLGKTETVTPAAVEQQAKQLRQQQASDSIASDDFVREAQAELDAELIAESVKPIQ